MHSTSVNRRIVKIEALAAGPSPHPSKTKGVVTEGIDRLRAKLIAHRERFTGKRTLPTIEGIQALSMAIRYLDGGRPRFLELVQNAVMHDQPAATQWWYVFADLTLMERTRVNFDDVCVGAGVKPTALMLEILSTEMEFGREVADVVRVAALPKVMGVFVKSALKEGDEIGERDRTRYLQSMNMIPTPRGTTIHVAANAQAAASAAMEPSVPSFAEDMKALTSARPRPQVIDVDPTE